MITLYIFAGIFLLTLLGHPLVKIRSWDYFVLGYFAHSFLTKYVQDDMGLEKYIEYCNENWVDYDPRLWIVCMVLIVLAYICYAKLERSE